MLNKFDRNKNRCYNNKCAHNHTNNVFWISRMMNKCWYLLSSPFGADSCTSACTSRVVFLREHSESMATNGYKTLLTAFRKKIKTHKTHLSLKELIKKKKKLGQTEKQCNDYARRFEETDQIETHNSDTHKVITNCLHFNDRTGLSSKLLGFTCR